MNQVSQIHEVVGFKWNLPENDEVKSAAQRPNVALFVELASKHLRGHKRGRTMNIHMFEIILVDDHSDAEVNKLHVIIQTKHDI